MSAHHFFVEPSAIDEGVVTIDGPEGHHAARVLRVRAGENITVADDTGRVVDATVTAVDDGVTATITKEHSVGASRPAITLFQALAKKDKFDLVVEKATEVGVARIVPLSTERSVVRWDDVKVQRSVDRWASIARAAAKQSRAPRIPEVSATATLDAFGTFDGPRVVLHETADRPLRDALPPDAPEALALLVGPEGGLSEDEIDRLAVAGADIVTLGPRILRTETAGPVAVAIIGHVYGWLG